VGVSAGRRIRGGALLVVAVLLLGLMVSAAATVAVDRAEDRYAGQVIDRYADDVTAAITDRINRYGETLSDLSAAVGAQSDLRGKDFARMTAGLNATRLPGASGIAFIVPAATGQVAAVQATWRSRGAAGLRLQPTANTADHEFVIFGRMFDGAATAAGLDVAKVPATTQALVKARQSGAMAISEAHVLLPDQALSRRAQQISVVVAAPVHTGGGAGRPDVFEGWLALGLRGTDFLSQALEVHTQGAVKVVLDDPAGAGTVIAGLATSAPVNHDDALVRERTVIVGQRAWHLTVYPTTRLLSRTDRWMSALAGGGGTLVTFLLALMTGILVSGRDRALGQVEQATAALRQDIDRREEVEAQLREREDQLRHLAFHDPLTGLANRILFYDRVSHALLTHGRAGETFAVFFLDLDGFKQVNDQWGHAAGDTVLCTVADRLRLGLRDSDTVARFGGDEFAVIVERLAATGDAADTAARIVSAVQEPIDVGARTATVTASVGIALNRPGDSADDLLREADIAMYTAKTTGKSRYVLATTER
jgi:diguanylate cyclase (GGDEF)-like protein